MRGRPVATPRASETSERESKRESIVRDYVGSPSVPEYRALSLHFPSPFVSRER